MRVCKKNLYFAWMWHGKDYCMGMYKNDFEGYVESMKRNLKWVKWGRKDRGMKLSKLEYKFIYW